MPTGSDFGAGGSTRTLGDLFGRGRTLGDYGDIIDVTPVTPSPGSAKSRLTFHSYDLILGRIVGQVPFTTWKHSEVLSRAGGWSAAMPASLARRRDDRNRTLIPHRSVIFVDDGGVLRFAGIVRDRASNATTFTVGGKGIWDYFAERYVTDDQNYPGIEQFTIVTQMLLAAQFGTRESIGLQVRPSPTATGILREREYLETEAKNYVQAIEDLAELEDGFDFVLTPQWVAGKPRLFLDLSYPRRGRVTDHVWQIGKHVALDGDYNERGEGANRIIGLGAGQGVDKVYRVSDIAAANRMRREEVISFSDITNGPLLKSHTNGELARQTLEQADCSVRILKQEIAGLDTWTLGDTIRLRGDVGAFDVDGLHRIEGYEMSADFKKNTVGVTANLVLGAPIGKPRPTPAQRRRARERDLQRRVKNLESQ